MTTIPKQALVLHSAVLPDGRLEIRLDDVDVPKPADGQVLVRVEAAPINPSDLWLLLAGADLVRAEVTGPADRPVLHAPLPPAVFTAAGKRVGEALTVGNEGAGTVVAAGESPGAQALMGRVVGFAGGSAYCQYRVLDAAACLPLPEGGTAEQGASSFVNPMTALAMVETMRLENHTGLVHTAAASNLGQMLNRLCLREGVPLVSIVRSPAQAQLLGDAGATQVCDSSAESFDADLASAIRETGATLAFDAIGGGTLAGRILTAMEAAVATEGEYSRYGSSIPKQVYIYGGLDQSPTMITRNFGMTWSLGGWLLTPFLQKVGRPGLTRLREQVAEGLATVFASHYTDRITLAGALDPDTIRRYARQATGTKYLITPQR